MKITKLTITNFLKLKDVEINPTHTNVISGKNKQGKTSILKAIKAAFSGEADESSIRIGEDKAEILIEMEDLNVKRTITQKGNYLDVSNKEGFKVPAPQKFLDNLLGTFSFNPIEFFEKKATDRKKYLLNAIDIKITPELVESIAGEKLTGIDYDQHGLEVVEDVRKYYYDKRTIANAEKTKKEKSLLDLTGSLPEGFKPSDVSEEQIEALRNAIQKDELEKQKASDIKELIVRLQTQEGDIKKQISDLEIKLRAVQDEIVAKSEMKFDFSDDVAMGAAKDTLKSLEGKREFAYTWKRAEETRAELDEAIKQADHLDVIVKKFTKEVPDTLVKEAKLPIEGLTIAGDEILINNVNLDNLSASEQMKFGLDIVRALNKKFQIICCDGLEMLDKETFEDFLNQIKDDDFQYFVTRVDGDSKNAIVVEEGEVKK